MSILTASLLFLFLSSTQTSVLAYNRPGCPDWPTEADWERDLRSKLSNPYFLTHIDRPIHTYVKQCLKGSQDTVDALTRGNGICMANHACANEFCQLWEPHNIPAYTVEAHTVGDIQAAVRFANKYDIAVSVKSSGHSFQSQSMHADSILIWLKNFPFTNKITTNFEDSCGTDHGPTVEVVAGENFDDILEGIKGQYNLVTGICRTVCLSGGWIQGGGMSFLSRTYGHGIDQPVSFQVVLPDATHVTADACNKHSDLFWALRGGGGGNFGIVTSVEYKLLEPKPITRLVFNFYDGIPYLEKLHPRIKTMIREWTDFFVRNLPKADTNWGGGFIRPTSAYMIYVGTAAEARQSTLLIAMDEWYDGLVASGIDPGFGKPSEILVESPNWYEEKGGAAAYKQPDAPAFAVPPSLGRGYSRMIPKEAAIERADELIDLIVRIGDRGALANIYFLGGVDNNKDALETTSAHPGLRDAVFGLEPQNEWANNLVKEFAGDKVAEWSVSYNHHDALEDDWENVLWGSNYPRLLEIKRKYDPDHRLNVWHGVDYKPREEWSTCGGNDHANIGYLKPFFLAAIRDLFGQIF